MQPDLQVRMLPVASLVPYAANERIHPDAQVAQLAASIAELGFNVPVLVDDRKWGTVRLGISKRRMEEEILKTRLEQGALTLAVTNAPGSPLAEQAELHLDIAAGPERAVAATKTYTAELLALLMLVEGIRAGDIRSLDDFARRLSSIDIYVWLPAGQTAATPADQAAALVEWLDARHWANPELWDKFRW